MRWWSAARKIRSSSVSKTAGGSAAGSTGRRTRSPTVARPSSSARRSPWPRRRKVEAELQSGILAESDDDSVLVSIRNLKTYYPIRGSFGQRLLGREAGFVKAVDDVSLELRKGEVLGLVGESGSGKTTLGRTLLGLVKASEGSVVFEGREITGMSERELRTMRRDMQIVFQDPH